MADPAPGDRVVAVKTLTTDEWFGFVPNTVGGGIEKIVVAPPTQSLFTALAPSTSFSWTELDIGCSRMLVTKFEVTASAASTYAISVYGGPSGTLEQMFTAAGFPDPVMSITWPWWYENQNDEQKMYIGIRNMDAVASNFSVTVLRGERLDSGNSGFGGGGGDSFWSYATGTLSPDPATTTPLTALFANLDDGTPDAYITLLAQDAASSTSAELDVNADGTVGLSCSTGTNQAPLTLLLEGQLADLAVRAGTPNAVISAHKGSLCFDVSTPALYQNTDGATAWSAVGAGSAPFDPSTGSWFYASSQSDTALQGKSGTANSFVSVPFTASGFVTNTSSGSDISVDGSGNIVINTSGVYAFHSYINPEATSNGATGYTEGSGRVLISSTRFGGNMRLIDTAFPATSRNGRPYVICTLSAELYLTAGDTITTQARMVGNGTPSTTWQITEAEIWVERHQ